MDRREILRMGAATIAAASFAKSAMAQNAAPAAAAPAGPPPTKSGLTVYSRTLQWCRTPAEVAKAMVDISLDHIDLTVQAYPGHVDPAKVKTDLPAFVNALKSSGITTNSITTSIVDADSANAEDIISTAAGLGIQNYVWGGLKYDEGQPYQPQLDGLKARVQKLARLNEKYKIKGLYHTASGTGNIGSGFYDILEVLKNFDSKFVALQYDTAALLGVTNQTFTQHMRTGGAYIGGIALNDAAVTLDLPEYEYGPFNPAATGANANNGPAGDNTGNANGNPLAIGGGGRPLPYHVRPVRVGTGMIDLTLIGKTLKAMNFTGPIETQVSWALNGVENGADKITGQRQLVIGSLKRDRLIVEAGFFAGGWNIDINRPAFLINGGNPVAGGRGGGGGGRGGAAAGAAGAGAAGGAPPGGF